MRMNFTYAGYLLFSFVGTLALMHVFRISFSPREKKAAIISLLATIIVFVGWDALAVWRNHWSFGMESMLVFFLGNQPIEEIFFFIIIPFFGIVLWKIIEKTPMLSVKTK
jgi:lycopene cyclase domain-containing protein